MSLIVILQVYAYTQPYDPWRLLQHFLHFRQRSNLYLFLGSKTPDARSQTYAHIMHQQNVSQEITRHKREINKKIESGEAKPSDFGEVTSGMDRKKKRIDLSGNRGAY